MNKTALSLAAALVGAALALAGCGGVGIDGDLGGTTDMANPPPVQPHFSSLIGDYFANCSNCHTPNAPGRTSLTEKTLDFSTAQTAYQTITTGMASGLSGNQTGCNGIPFLTAMTPAQSLIVAVLDAPTRAAFDLPAFPSCDAAAIPDETVKVGTPPSAEFVAALKQWVQAGAPND